MVAGDQTEEESAYDPNDFQSAFFPGFLGNHDYTELCPFCSDGSLGNQPPAAKCVRAL